jgi:hypothetical protein
MILPFVSYKDEVTVVLLIPDETSYYLDIIGAKKTKKVD